MRPRDDRPVPAHWIRPNEVTRVPRRHIVIDCEAHSTPTERGEIQTFRLAVGAFDHQDRKGTKHQPTQWGRFTDAKALWEWVDGCTVKGRRTVLVAHNLAYDLRISEAFIHLPAMGWELEMIRLDRGQAWAQWRCDGRALAMIDSVSWFGSSLETVGKLVKLGKLDLPTEEDTDEAWFARCTRDVEILREAWRRVLDWVEVEDMGNWKPTGAGQGWASFRHKWLTHKILHHGIEEVAGHEREAAWTGRCEAWKHGDLGLEPWYELDFQSAYTAIAFDCEVPVRLSGRLSPSECKRFLKGVEGRCALLHVEVTTESPTVPTRGPHGILWPVGTFTSWLWDVEAREVERDGGTIRILGGWSYRTAPALRAWAGWVLDRLDDDAGSFDPVLRLVVKGWSRSVVGRFGSRWAQWEPYGEAHGPDVTLSTLIDGDTKVSHRTLTLGTKMMIEGDVTDAPDGAVHVMSYIMAVARVRLLTAMRIAGLDHVAYVDTDGLLVDAEGLARLNAAALPGLRVKSAWSHVEVLGPRQLILDGKLRAAGVPGKAVRTGARSWSGEVWRSLGGSLAQGEQDRVVLTERTWVMRGVDTRRAHLADGATAPVRLPAPL